MVKEKLFGWLVDYFCRYKWPVCAPCTINGKFTNPCDPDFKPGDENPFHGALIFADGERFPKTMSLDQLINPEEVSPFESAADSSSFHSYLERFKKEDGAIVYDSKNTKIAHVGLIKQKSPKLAQVDYRPEEALPRDFKSYDASVPVTKRGARTDIAIRVSQSYPVDAYQITTTAYNELGMGQVTHFRQGILRESFHLEVSPDGKGPYVDSSRQVIGVYRRYVDEEGRPCRNEKGELIPYLEERIDQNLHDGRGKAVNSPPTNVYPLPSFYQRELRATA